MLSAATWNVRSLVDVEGSLLTASRCRPETGHSDTGPEPVHREERKIDLVVRQLQRLGLEAAGLQETLWFGKEVYNVGDSVVLTSGRPAPCPDSPCLRGEGVALVLRGLCRAAFVQGGCVWKAHSSRLLSASLTFVCGRNQRAYRVHVAVAYAPTFARPRCEKTEFLAQLQTFLVSVPTNEHYIILGDFNARVGSASRNLLPEEDEWRADRGPHGFGVMNPAGEELLTFLSLLHWAGLLLTGRLQL